MPDCVRLAVRVFVRLASLVILLSSWPALAVDRTIEFNRDIRPILSDKCYRCHGTDATAKGIPLRLDSEAAATADLGDNKHAIVPGNPESSQLVRRITAEDEAIRMPPVYSGLKLTDREIETLRSWIAQGAKWQLHWSFIPPNRYPLPAVKNTSWPRNPIDHFVLERLDREGLFPAPEASRETLLRRVSLDLTGLPPTPAEIDAFLKDKSGSAYERVVDRLLASPRYGERMAARWLDAARYADTNGYQFDGERFMWRWRDWVIEAFNRNQPFDQFTLEQIAGDLLPNATLEQKIATGFNRNHRGNTEDGIIPEEYAVEYVVDRVETTSAVFLGLTLGCARCHNHKYDPFSQKEFYQLFAYFNNVPERGRAMKFGNSPPLVHAPTREQQRALRQLDERIQSRRRFPSTAKQRRSTRPKQLGSRNWPKKNCATGRPRPAWRRHTASSLRRVRSVLGEVFRWSRAELDAPLPSMEKPFSMPERLRVSISKTASRWPPGCTLIQLPMAPSSHAWWTIPRARVTDFISIKARCMST